MAVFANIVSTFDPRGLNNARKTFAALASDSVSSSRKSQLAMKLLGGAAATAGAAVGAFAIKLGVDGVKAAIEDEKSVKNLGNTLRNLGLSFQQTGIEQFVSKMQFATGVADSALRPAMNQLLLATNNVTQSQRMLQLALDISASTGKDLESVTLALSKAATGNFTALTRLGIPLDKTIIKNKDLGATLDILESKFEGASAAAATTLGGKIEILRQRVDEAKEAIGYDLITAIELATGALDGSNGLGESITNTGDRVGDFIVGIGALIDKFNELTDASQKSEKSFTGLLATIVKEIFAGAVSVPVGFFNKIADAGKEYKNVAASTVDIVKGQTNHMQSYSQTLGFVAKKVELTTEETRELAEAEKRAEQQLKKTQEAAKKAAQDGIDVLEESLRKAKSQLDDIQGKFDDFKGTISGGISGVIDFNAAVEEGNFLNGLVKQADNAKKYADRVKTLIQLGLSERALRSVIDAGYESGTIIADQIIAGGSTVVTQVNSLVAAVDEVANIVGQTGAETFYAAGVAQGQAMVAGIEKELSDAKSRFDALIASFTNQIPAAVAAPPSSQPSGKPPVKYTPTPPPPAAKTGLAAASLQIQNKIKSMTNSTRFAEGGIVLGPTNAIIGEAGPEAVIPLSGANSVGMGATYNITVNAGIGTDGAVVGRQIVDAIRKYERSSGQVFARV